MKNSRVNAVVLCRFLALVALLAAVVSGCSGNKKGEQSTEPAKLKDFKHEISMKRLWSHDLGDGQGKLYNRLRLAIDGGLIFAADNDGKVFALKRKNGDRIWKRDINHDITGGVGAGHGYVLVGTPNGRVYALDEKSGKKLWHTWVGGEVLAPPQTDGNIVVVQTYDGYVIGLNAADGKKLWHYSVQLPVLQLRGTAAPVLRDGVVYTGFANGHVVALNINDGTVRWEGRVALPEGKSEIDRMVDVDGSPLVMDNAVYAISYHGRVAAFSRRSGQLMWFQDASSYVGLAEGFSNIYYVTADGSVIAADENSGNLKWEQSALAWRQLSAPTTFSSYVVVGDFEGYLHFLSQVDGHFVDRIDFGSGGIRAPILAVGDTIYVYGNKGKLAAYRLNK